MKKATTMKSATYVLDTSALIEDPDVFYKLGGSISVIPGAVIKELDGLKRNPDPNDQRAKASRKVTRTLDRLSSYQDISAGAVLSTGGVVRICPEYIAIDDLASKADNRIVGTAIKLHREGPCKVILLSTDGNMRNVTRSYGIQAENYPFILEDFDVPKSRTFTDPDPVVPELNISRGPHQPAQNVSQRSPLRGLIAVGVFVLLMFLLFR